MSIHCGDDDDMHNNIIRRRNTAAYEDEVKNTKNTCNN